VDEVPVKKQISFPPSLPESTAAEQFLPHNFPKAVVGLRSSLLKHRALDLVPIFPEQHEQFWSASAYHDASIPDGYKDFASRIHAIGTNYPRERGGHQRTV
jgi:hypothetical protein